MKLATAVVVVTVCLGVGGGEVLGKSKRSSRHHQHRHKRSADPLAEGRSHLKKANALAGEGDCAAAISEYTAAYEQLEDPVVLFNRGECYRRTGDADKAVADYRAFLDKVPQARNRADIEAKIAALAPPPEPAEPEAAPSRRATPPPAVARPAAPAPPAAPAATLVADEQTAAAADTHAEGGGSHWWAWTLLGALVVGGAVAGIVMFQPQESQPPDSMWGNYRF